MRTWRTCFLCSAMVAFLVLCELRAFRMPLRGFWHVLVCGIFGAALAMIINEWEHYHQDWMDLHYYTDEELEERERNTPFDRHDTRD